ncbi:MAG: hypothetical protein LIO97_12130 [Tannerellaceae bacterium]|nr:hypothetical protein [Tannerellaceae bacterium]
MDSLCKLVGLKGIPARQLDSYWLLLEVSHKRGSQQEPKELEMGNVSMRVLYVLRSHDICSEDDPNLLLYLFSSLQKPTALFRQIIVECYLNLPPGRSREVFRRLSLGEDIYTLTEETGLTQKQLYRRYEAAVNELMAKQFEVLSNLRLQYALVERINYQEKVNRRLVKSIEEREGQRSEYYKGRASGGIVPSPEVLRRLSLSFTDLRLSYHLRCLLINNGIETMVDLLRVLHDSGPTHLLMFKNFGKRSLATLKEKLMEAGLVDEQFDSVYFDYID